MTYAEKVAWLRRYQDSLRQEKERALEVERLRTEAERITPLLTGMPGGGSTMDRLPRAVEGIVQAQQELENQINACRAARGDVSKAIDQVQHGREHEILRRRYLLGQRWESIAVDMEIDYRWVWRLHKRTVNKLTIESDI